MKQQAIRMARWGWCGVLVFVSLGPWLCVAQATPAALPMVEQRFAEAAQLYDQSRFAEACEKYQELLKEGWRSPQLFYNLGNACFKAGKLDLAVLNYRRAWYFAPRDPDVRANLQYALQTAGAPPPDMWVYERVLSKLSRREWTMVAVTAWWGACLFCALGLWSRAHRNKFFRCAALSSVILIVSLCGLWTWHRLTVYSEQVVTGAQLEVRFAPLDNAVLHFMLPRGSIVRLLESTGDWAKISADRKEGWVRKSSLIPIFSRETGVSPD